MEVGERFHKICLIGSILKQLPSIDQKNGNLLFVKIVEFGVVFDADLLPGEGKAGADLLDDNFRVLTQPTFRLSQ